MNSGILNATHPIMQFNVLHSKKPQGSNAKKYKYLQIYKWNFCSMLLKFLSTILKLIIQAP